MCLCVCGSRAQDNVRAVDDASLLPVLIADLGADDLSTRESAQAVIETLDGGMLPAIEIGRASCRERV